MEPEPFNAPVIVDAHGRPARRPETAICPTCGAGTDQRGPDRGFGVAQPLCLVCGHVWEGDVFRG